MCVLLGSFVVLSVACGGLSSISVPAPQVSESVKLKDNQVKGWLVTTDPKTGELTLDMDGTQKKYMRADGCKFYMELEDTKTEPNLNYLLKRDVVLTLEKKDGKELVTEIRGAPRSTKLTTKGTRVEGTFKTRDGKTGDVKILVGGTEKSYATDELTRFYDQTGLPIRGSVGQQFGNVQVQAAVENKGGRDYLIEMRPK
jgi:hypothetical protein